MNSCIKYIFLFTRRLFLLPPLPHHPLVCCSWPRDSAGKSRNFYCWKTGSMTFLNCKFALSLQSLLNWLQQWWIITDDQQQLMYCGTSILTKGNTSLYPPKNLQVLQYFSTQVLQHLSINIVHCLRDYVRCQSGSDRSHLQRWKRYNRYSWSSKAD